MPRRLNFSKEYKELLLRREKVTTIRMRLVASPGERMLVYAGEEKVGEVVIEKVLEKKVKELSDSDAQMDGFKSVKQLKKALKKHYNDIDEEDTVYIHFMKWIE